MGHDRRAREGGEDHPLTPLARDGTDGGNFIRLAWTVDAKASTLEVLRQYLNREEPIDQARINLEKEKLREWKAAETWKELQSNIIGLTAAFEEYGRIAAPGERRSESDKINMLFKLIPL